MPGPSILLFAGEASGDYHAAALVREIKKKRPEVNVSGIGGDALAAEGMELLYHYRDVNTIGLSEGLTKVRNIVTAYRHLKRELLSGRHDLFIPVDYPDVNLRLCSFAKRARVPVVWYISPQVWAWRRGRIRKIAARVDRMMTIFPFEERLYREAGIRADFVGHTMARDISGQADKIALKRELGLDPSRPGVAIVPGSRPAEIRRMLPIMCQAAALHLRHHPAAQFALPLAGEHLRPLVAEILGQFAVPMSVHTGAAARLMAGCDFGLVTSGTATLQAALAEMPHAVAYVLDALTWWFAIRVLRPLVMDKDLHVAMANVLAINQEKESSGPIAGMQQSGNPVHCLECGRPLFVPELLQDHATADRLAQWLDRFAAEQSLRDAMIKGFRQIREMLDPPRLPVAAADIVLEFLDSAIPPSKRPS
jgi:lipid-A-disaccharide synthase